jgi:hypothetical protein
MKFLYLTLSVSKDCKFSSVFSGYGIVVCQISYIFLLLWHGYVSSDPHPEKIQSVTCPMDDIVDLDSLIN